MPLHSQFDVAHLLGHSAFDHLAGAMSIYDRITERKLLDPNSHPWPECFSIGLELCQFRKAELEQCVQAVILFQAMMEKVPYFVPGIGTGLTTTSEKKFTCSWRSLLAQIKDDKTQKLARAAFGSYCENFYRAFRNPIIHGRDSQDIEKINKIRVPGVHEGMRNGWRAYDYLLAEAFAPDQTHEPSWTIMCKAHRIPEAVNLNDYPDLKSLEGRFNKRHLDGASEAADSK